MHQRLLALLQVALPLRHAPKPRVDGIQLAVRLGAGLQQLLLLLCKGTLLGCRDSTVGQGGQGGQAHTLSVCKVQASSQWEAWYAPQREMLQSVSPIEIDRGYVRPELLHWLSNVALHHNAPLLPDAAHL